MKKRAQEIFDTEVKNIILANNPEQLKASFDNLAKLASLLDAAGSEADADTVDNFIKEAAGFWDFLLGFGGGAATTKDEQGNYFSSNMIDAIKGGDFSKIFDKKNLAKVLTRAVGAGAITLLTSEIIEKLSESVPGFKLIKDAPFTKMAISGALSYAITNSDFVEKLIEGASNQFSRMFSGTKEQAPQPQQNNVVPLQPKPPVAQPQQTQPKQEEQKPDSANFNIAASLKDK